MANNQLRLIDQDREIQILVGSDNVLLRDLLEFRIAEIVGIRLVGSSGLDPQLINLMDELRPDVAVLTIKLSYASAGELEFIRDIRSTYPEVRLITVSSQYLPRQVAALGQYGVGGILLESQGWDTLHQAIRSVYAGDFFTTQSVAGSVLRLRQEREVNLTIHEIQLMELVSEGLSNSAIARQLNVSESTVRSRLSNTLQKLNVTNRTQAVTEVIRRGYVSPKRPANE